MDLLDAREPVSQAARSREAYLAEQRSGFVNYDTQFSYALDLLKSNDSDGLRMAETLLRRSFLSASIPQKRECLYLIAIANTKMGHYEKAIECCNNLLAVNPGDHQSSELKAEIERRRRRGGIIGASLIASGIFVAIGVITALAFTRPRTGSIGLSAIGLASAGVALGVVGAAAAYVIQKSKENKNT